MIEKERKSVDYLVVNELKKQSLTISLAESCTGGKIASLMTSRSGASSYFKGGLVCYSKSSKVNILNIAISITGNAGPTRGDLKKKIGTVFIGIAKYSEVMVHKFSFSGDRDKIIKNTVEQSFKLIYRELIKE